MNLQPFKYNANKVCSRCIMDDTVRGITFDENGVCTFCHIHDEIEAAHAPGAVSYTHLDVYKRQVLWSDLNRCVLKSNRMLF